jgi:hypothetical protein
LKASTVLSPEDHFQAQDTSTQGAIAFCVEGRFALGLLDANAAAIASMAVALRFKCRRVTV